MNWKQIGLSGVTFVFAVYLTLATAYAQTISSSSASTQVDYQLPYPGMLPDNPLYFLKAFRDNMAAFFLSKPLDKAQFDLLQSDKNVQASYLLTTQEVGKESLAAQTFSKGQDDFSEAITQTAAAQKEGYSIGEMSKVLDLANQKHLQILKIVEQQNGQKDSQEFQTELGRTKEFAEEIKTLHQ
jgi:hypothetical protein